MGAPIAASGADEIAAMGRAVEVFRRNTLERDELFAEKAQAAERLEQQVKERTAELAETLEHQTATGYVLDVIGRSPTDVQPVFQRIADSAATLCEARFCNVFRFDGQLIHFAASHGLQPDEHRTIAGLYPVSPGRGSVAARAIQGRSVEEIPDIDVDPNYQHGPMIKGIGYRSIVGVPMLMGGQPIGAIVVSRTRAGHFPARQIQLLETFADQAVIAIKNVGLFDEVQARTRELSRSVAELKALGEVSQAVNSTIDLEMVLSTIVAKAVQLSDTEAGTIYVFDEASQEFRLHSTYGMDEALVAGMRDRPIRAGQGTIVDRATSQRTPLQIADVQSDTESSLIVYDIIVRAGFRALLAIPLLARDRIVGALVVRRKKPGGFPKGAVEILQTFAEQSVLAIQNARLFNEAQEALAQQTTTSDILRVISGSPTDVTPVYNAVVEAAVRLLACDFALVLRTDGKTFSPVAGATPAGPMADMGPSGLPVDPGHNFPSRAIVSKSVLHVPDWSTIELPPHEQHIRDALGCNSTLYLPLVRANACLGVLAYGRRKAHREFTAKEIALASSFRDQTMIAIENTRLFSETKEALERQTATSEILGVISSSPADIQPVFDAIAESAGRLCVADDTHIWRREGAELHVVASQGASPLTRRKLTISRGSVVGRAAHDRMPVHVEDLVKAFHAEFPDSEELRRQATGPSLPCRCSVRARPSASS